MYPLLSDHLKVSLWYPTHGAVITIFFELAAMYGFEFSSSYFAIAPDCRSIILLSKKIAILWKRSNTGIYEVEFDFLELPIGSDSLSFQFGEGVSFSPDGSLFSATWTQYSLDGMTVGIWETTNYRIVSQPVSTENNTVSGPAPCKSLQFSKDGGTIATTRVGSTSAFIWEVSQLLIHQIQRASTKRQPIQPRPNKQVITLSPNGKVLALSHAQTGMVEFWNLAPGPENPVAFERVWKYQVSDLEAPECDETECSCWSFVPRPLFYSGGEGFLFPCYSTHEAKNLRLVFFNMLSGTVDYSTKNRFPGLNKIKVSPSNGTIVTGSFDGMLRIWAPEAHPSLLIVGNGFPTARTIDHRANYDIFSQSFRGGLVEFSPDGGKVVFAHRTHQSYLLCLRLRAPRNSRNRSTGSYRYLHHLALATVSHICKTDNGRFGEFRSIGFSPDGKLICCGGTKGIIDVWDFKKQTLKFSLDYRTFFYPEMIGIHPRPNIDLGMRSDSGVDQITVSPNGKLIAAAYGHLATSFNAVQRYSDGLPAAVKHHSHGNTLKGLFDKQILIRVWDIATRKQINAFVIEFFDTRASQFPMRYPDSWFSFTEDSKYIIANTVFMDGKIFPVTRTAPPTPQEEAPKRIKCRKHGRTCIRRMSGVSDNSVIVMQRDTLEYQRRHGTGVSGYEADSGSWIYYGNRPIIYIPPQTGIGVGIQCHDNTVVLSTGMVKNYKFSREADWEQYSEGVPQIMVLSFDPSKFPFDPEKMCQKPLVWDSKFRPPAWYCESAKNEAWETTIDDVEAGLVVKCLCYLSRQDPYEKFRDSEEFKRRMMGTCVTSFPGVSEMDVFEISIMGTGDPNVDSRDERKLLLYYLEACHLTSEEMKIEEENCTKPDCTVPPIILDFRDRVQIEGLVLPKMSTFPMILPPFGERRGPTAQTCVCHCEHRSVDEADLQTVDYALKVVGNHVESDSQPEIQEEGLSRYVKDFDNFLTKGQDWSNLEPEVEGQPWGRFSKRKICINSR